MTEERRQAARASLEARGDEAQRARALALLAVIRRGVESLEDDFYDVGVALRELRDAALFRAIPRETGVPYASFESLVKAEAGVPAALARKLLAIVEIVPRDEALSLGADGAHALTRRVSRESK